MSADGPEAEGVVPREVLVEILSAGPDDFVAARTAASRRIRAEGDRTLAAAVAKVRKPTRLVWRLQEAAAASPDALAELRWAAAEARHAQGKGDGPALRAATAAVRGAVEDLAGGDVEIGQAFRGLVADEGTLDEVADGVLLALPGATVDGLPAASGGRRTRRTSPKGADVGAGPSRPASRPRDATGSDQTTTIEGREPARRRSTGGSRSPEVDLKAIRAAKAAVREATHAEQNSRRALTRAQRQLAAAQDQFTAREEAHARAAAVAEAARKALDVLTGAGGAD